MTQPGIGGAGILGFALEVLPAPTGLSATAQVTGGTLADDDYFYVVTARNADGGETVISNEDSATVSGGGGNGSVDLTWTAVTNATDYRIYRSLTTGGPYGLLNVSVTNSFTDDGSDSPGAAPPTANTAFYAGTYTAPTKYACFMSESLNYLQETVWRRPICQSVDVVGAVDGNVHVEGEIEMEAFGDVVPYFLLASRASVVKTDNNPDFIYTYTPDPSAVPDITLSITIVRNDIVFGYTGCVLSQFVFTTTDEGELMFNCSILGRDEAVQATPTPTFDSEDVFGAGSYDVTIGGTQVFDTDTFEFTVNDNGEPQFRLKNTGRGAEFIKYGEREVTLSLERDFLDRTDYDAFKALTSQAISLRAENTADNYIDIDIPVAVKDTYELGLEGQGELVRAAIEYMGVQNASGDSYTIAVATQEDITQVS